MNISIVVHVSDAPGSVGQSWAWRNRLLTFLCGWNLLMMVKPRSCSRWAWAGRGECGGGQQPQTAWRAAGGGMKDSCRPLREIPWRQAHQHFVLSLPLPGEPLAVTPRASFHVPTASFKLQSPSLITTGLDRISDSHGDFCCQAPMAWSSSKNLPQPFHSQLQNAA